MCEDKIYYVYIWYIVDTGEVFYVGKGKGKRYKQTSHRNKFFNDMYNSHNCDVKKIYENLTESEAFQKEKDTVKWFRENTSFRLTNQTDGGEGLSGWKPSQEFKDKQSKIHKEQWENEEFKNKMMAIRTDENGPYKSQEFRNKIAQLVQGENNPNYNHKWTDEMKYNLSKKRIENGIASGENNPMATKVICLETGEVFNLIKYALDKYHIKDHSNMSAALRDPIRTAGGMHWMVYTEELKNDEIRIQYLINACIKNKTVRPAICIDDMQIFINSTLLAKELGLTVSYIKYYFDKDGSFIYNGKKYMRLSDYISITNRNDCEEAV